MTSTALVDAKARALDLKQNISHVEESEERYRSLVTSMRDGIYHADSKGRLSFMNQAGMDIFGFTSEKEAAGHGLRALFADDSDLNGFATLPQREITLMGVKGIYSDISGDSTFGDWGPAAGARAAIGGGNLGSSTTGNPFRDRLGNGAHAGTGVAYSNAGSLVIPVGVSLYPIAGHRFTVYYTYVGFLDDETLRNAGGASTGVGSISKDLYHQISGVWQWNLNRHFDIRLVGAVYVPGEGTKDMAETVFTCGNGTEQCDGDDIALRGVARFRARF